MDCAAADPAAAAPVLGVDRSVTGRRWLCALDDDRMALALCQRAGVPDLLARVLVHRGIGPDEVEAHLAPTLRRFLPDPSRLRDMDLAAERLAAAIMAGEAVGIFGDYDVDGATSTALMSRFVTAAGGRSLFHIPDRQGEGYGPNAPALLRLKEDGAGVVVTVDCGTAAFEPLAEVRDAGLDVVVCDHHKAEPRLPPAVAVVNPNRLDDDSQQGHLAAVGVAFLMAVATNRTLRRAGWYDGDRPEPDPLQWLDLVALGTVCDMVPLVGVNRALVAQGLKVMGQGRNVGVRALAEVAGLQERPDAWHLGFMLGPRVNAGGRVGDAETGARLLTTEDMAEALTLARRLDACNGDRQAIEADVLLAAMEQVEGRADDGGPLVLVAGEGWHPGVLGIVAGRLKERYNRPACVLGIEGGLAKGSGRSVAGIDLGAAVMAARQDGILLAGGGHAMAAGFTVETARLKDFHQFLVKRLAEQAEAGALIPTLHLDGTLEAAGATFALVDSLRRLGPFGSGNPEPRFAVANVRVVRPEVVGMGHVRCTLVGPAGARLKGIAFRSADSELGYALLANTGTLMHVAGTLRPDTWLGRSDAQIFIDDAAFAR